jgi:hypothetical protein
MTVFSGNPNDLRDSIAYELSAIEYLRSTLHLHDEAPVGSTTVTLGDLTPEGELRRAVSMVGRSDMSGTAVRAALSRLRPLAFSASFKLQDMVAEWLLRANGVSDWQFSKKLAAYDKLLGSGSLASPPLLAANSPVSKAFWELYRFLVPFRGTVMHSGGVLVRSDGTVSITKDSRALDFTSTQQASYMRAMCLIGKILSAQLSSNAFVKSLIESDLCELAVHHKQPGLTVTYSRLASLEVEVPPSHVRAAPVAFEVDFDQLRRTMEKTYGVGNTARIYFCATIRASSGDQHFRWGLPFEAIPSGIVTLQEGDPQYDGFLTISVVSS